MYVTEGMAAYGEECGCITGPLMVNSGSTTDGHTLADGAHVGRSTDPGVVGVFVDLDENVLDGNSGSGNVLATLCAHDLGLLKVRSVVELFHWRLVVTLTGMKLIPNEEIGSNEWAAEVHVAIDERSDSHGYDACAEPVGPSCL